MSLAISGSCGSFPVSAANNIASLYGNGGKVDSCTSSNGDDAVRISTEGRLLASSLLEGLVLPTEENVHRLSAVLSEDLGDFLSESGVSTQPPIELDVDWSNGDIKIKGERADSEKIQGLINGNEEIKEQIRNLAAISSHAVAMADSLKFQKEYLASGNAESVVAGYSCLFGSNQQSGSISLLFDGNNIQVMSDGRQWISS